MSKNLRAWEQSAKVKYDLFAMNPYSDVKTNRQARVRRALDKKTILPCAVTTQEVNGDQLHQGSTGGLKITGDSFVTVKLPYCISANDIWRATIDESTGKQPNSLSLSAKNLNGMYFRFTY